MSTDQFTDLPPIIEPHFARPNGVLHSGDRLKREEFHRLYEQTPPGFKAELIGGIVYVASPVSPAHGKVDRLLGSLLAAYEGSTPGIEGSCNTTVFLSDKDELQPNQYLRILPEFGGQSNTVEDGYVSGGPELVVEVAYSSQAIDLHAKKRRYARNGVHEYMVACVKEQQLRWFDLAGGQELHPDANGVCRVRTFPGLWIDGKALMTHDYSKLMDTLQQGLATPEHAAFVQELESRRGK